MANWYVLIESASGRAISFSSIQPVGYSTTAEVVTIAGPPTSTEQWSSTARAIVSYTPPADPLVADYAAATTTDQRLDVIAKRIGLK